MSAVLELPKEVGGIPIRYELLPSEPQYRYSSHPRIEEDTFILPWNGQSEWQGIFLLREGIQFLLFHSEVWKEYDEGELCQAGECQLWFGGMDEIPFLRRLHPDLCRTHPHDFLKRQEEAEAGFYDRLKPPRTIELEKSFGVTALRHGSIWATPLPYSWDDLRRSSLVHQCPFAMLQGEDSEVWGGKHRFTGKFGTHSRHPWYVTGGGLIEQEGVFGEGVLASGRRQPLQLAGIHYLERRRLFW